MVFELIKKIDNLKSFDKETIMETFTIEERSFMVFKVHYVLPYGLPNKITTFIKKANEMGIRLFTDEELNSLRFSEYDRFVHERIIYYQYSDEMLLKMMLDEEAYSYGMYMYLKDDESFYKLVDLYIKDELPESLTDSIEDIISNAKSDECKINCINKLANAPKRKRLDNYDKASIISSLSSDDKKIEMLSGVSVSMKSRVICSMESDDTKVRYINLFSLNKGDIIQSLNDDELKEFYFKKYYRIISGETRANIIASFDDENITRKYLPLVNGNNNLESFIYSCHSDELKYEAAKKITSDAVLYDVIKGIKNDDYQVDLLRRIKNVQLMVKGEEDSRSTLYNFGIKAKIYLIPYVKDSDKETVIRGSSYPANFILLPYLRDFDKAIEILSHFEDEDMGKYEPAIDPTIDYICKNLNISVERVHKLVNATSPLILKYIKSQNIIDCLNLSDEDFAKYLEIINPKKRASNKDSINDALNVILSRRYRYDKKEDYEIFASFQAAIESRNAEQINTLINQLSTLIDISNKIPNREEFIENLIQRDINTINYLHVLTQEYIRISKDNYLRENIPSFRKKIVPIKVDRGEYIKLLFAGMETEDIVKLIKRTKEYIEEKELLELIENEDLLISLIEYKKNPQAYGEPSKELKKSLKTFNILLNQIYQETSAIINQQDGLRGFVRTVEEEPHHDINSVVYILSELNTAELRDTVFPNEELYQELLKTIHGYRLLGWTEEMKQLATESGFFLYDGVISALIGNYEAIKRNLADKVAKGEIPQATMTHIIDLAACYDSSSYVYRYIFGNETFMLLKSNPGPYKASMGADERLSKGLELASKIKARESVTTPPIDKDYTIQNKKRLHIRLGHVNSLDNLVYGEKTGACMRLGGFADSLFHFCLLDKNGFHIEFTDPDTHEFISRVSGFRNGNTVFLNQLRYSKNPAYKNEDIIEAIKMVASDIIELSKKSDFPIDNVVISPDYAFSKTKEEVVDLKVNDIHKGVKDFYTDVSRHAIVLSTAASEGKFVPLVLGTKRLPEYEPLRDRVRIYKGEEAVIKINEMTALDDHLSGKPIEDIEIKEILDINTCYVGNDWYISISNDGQITTYIMKSCRDKEKAEQEMKKNLEVFKASSEKQIQLMRESEEYSSGSSRHL